MVIALAGRRIDAPGASVARFPESNVSCVLDRLRHLFIELGARAIVSSAACGADLLALEAAAEAGLRRRIVLPFEPHIFRRTSVTDRGGDWGYRFDRRTEDSEIIVLRHLREDDDAYAAANHAILDEATALAAEIEQTVTAVIVWNGTPRGERDLTAAFGDEARRRGLPVVDVPTL